MSDRLEMRPVLICAELLWKDAGIKEGATVTSGKDGEHSAGSYHYYGLAYDFRTRYWDNDVAAEVAVKMKAALGGDYDVVVHKHGYDDNGLINRVGHMHVEYDKEQAECWDGES